jgi:hypothetical protein
LAVGLIEEAIANCGVLESELRKATSREIKILPENPFDVRQPRQLRNLIGSEVEELGVRGIGDAEPPKIHPTGDVR